MVGRLIGILGAPFTGWGPTVIDDTITEIVTAIDTVSATAIVVCSISEAATASDSITVDIIEGRGIELSINF